MSNTRKSRLGDQIHHAIAQLLSEKVNDKRLKEVTVITVDVTPDLSRAKIFIVCHDETKKEETLKVLKQASGFLRHELAETLNLRVTPRLMFIYDESIGRGTRINKLLNQ